MPTTLANVVAKSVTGGRLGASDQSFARDVLPANVGDAERLASAVGGAALIGYGLSCRGLLGVLLPVAGGALLFRGVSGTCGAYAALGVSTNEGCCGPAGGVKAGAGHKLEDVVTVNRPADELFRFWRRFDNLPKFMDHLKSVQVLDGKRSKWVAKAPLGASVGWEAEVIREEPGRLIAWRSLPGADVDTAGSVHFTPVAGGRGTEVRVALKYDPPAGRLGAWAAALFGEAPEQQVRDDLRRFKQLMEAGEIAVGPGDAKR